MLDDSDKYGFLIIDGNGALFAVVQGNSFSVLHKLQVSLPKKHRNGGQSSVRFARLRMEARHNYLTKVAELSVKHFINSTTSRPNVKGIVLAGSADFKTQLSTSNFLDGRLQSIIVSIVDVAYGFTQGLQQAIELSSECLKGVSLVQQNKILSKFFEEISLDTGKFIFGLQRTMSFLLDVQVVETLICWENLTSKRLTLLNSNGDRKIIYCQEGKDPVLQDDEGKWEIVESELLVDWLVENYRDLGIKLQLVQDCTSEGSQFCRGFGGLGAILHYKTDMPEDDDDDVDDGEEFGWFDGDNDELKEEKDEEELLIELF